MKSKFDIKNARSILSEDRANRELTSLIRVLQATDRILSGRDMSVTLTTVTSTRDQSLLADVGGWTDGKNIWINESVALDTKKTSETFASFVASVKGLNYHELAHILFTPRLDGLLAKRVLSRGKEISATREMWWCFNALEDQKVEMLFGKRYGLAYSYFKHTNLEYIIKAKDQDFKTLLSLEHGRLFLPKELRRKLFTLFADEHGLTAAREIADVIEEYILLNTSEHMNAIYAVDLVERMYKALPKSKADENAEPDRGKGNIDVENPAGHFILPEDVKSAKNGANGKPAEGIIVEGRVERNESGERESLKDDFSDDDVKETSLSAKEKDEKSPFSNKSDVASPVSRREKKAINGMKEDASRSKNDNLGGSSRFSDDVKKTSNAVTGHPGADLSIAEMGTFVDIQVTSEMLSHQPRLTNVLRKLRLDSEPIWHKGQSSGSVNPERAMLADVQMDLDVFDLWDEGSEEEGGVEVVLLLDLSSSMWTNGRLAYGKDGVPLARADYRKIQKEVENGTRIPSTDIPIVAASQAIWMLKRTMGQLDTPVTVLGYNGDWSVLYHAKEQVSHSEYRLFDASGGTNPRSALDKASKILGRSRLSNKVMVIITDGEWGFYGNLRNGNMSDDLDERNRDEAIMAMTLKGYTTMILGINGAVAKFGDHGSELSSDLNDVMDIASAVEDLVKTIMLRAANDDSAISM